MAGVNRGWGPIRCTWGNNKPDRTKTQQKIIQLHGYRSRPISRNLAEISIAYVIGKREAATNATQPKPNPLPAILVYGTPSSPELTQASWFRAEDKEAVKAAAEALKFSVIELQTDADRALAAGAHEGVLKGRGRMIVGSVSAEVYRRIEEHVRKAAGAPDPSKPDNAATTTTKSAKAAGADAPAKAETAAATTTKP